MMGEMNLLISEAGQPVLSVHQSMEFCAIAPLK